MSIEYYKIDSKTILNSVYNTIFLLLLYSIIFRNIYGYTIRDSGLLNMSVLLYGQYGATLVILSFYKLISTNNYNLFKKLFFIIGILLGLIVIFISGSKSPLIAIAITLIYLYKKKLSLLKSTFFISLLFIFTYNFAIDIIMMIDNFYPNTFLERTVYAAQNYDLVEGRTLLFFTGINEYIANPILGNAFLLTTSSFEGSYSHNLILESFLALGFFGGILFLTLNYKVLTYANEITLSNKNDLVSRLFIQFFIFGMFSGNLFSSTMYWICIGLIFLFNKRES